MMAKYRLTSPAGETYEITAPDDASQEQVLSYFQSQMQQGQQPEAPDRPRNPFVSPGEQQAPIEAEAQTPQYRTTENFRRVLREGGVSDQDFERLARTGITPGTATEFAAAHIQMRQQEREEEGRDRLNTREREAIHDLYKGLAGRDDLSSQDFFAQQQEYERQSRNETLFGRAQNFGLNVMSGLAAPTTSVVGLASPETAADLREQQQAAYNPGGGASGFAGQVVGEGANVAGALALGPYGMAALYGGRGAGRTRTDIEQRRQQGEEISGWQEALAAGGIGLVEGASGFVGHHLFRRIGNAMSRMGTENVTRTGIRRAISEGTRAAGLTGTEALEEAATELAVNKISQGTYDPDRAVTEGVAEAFVMGGILAPLGGQVMAKAQGSGVDGTAHTLDQKLRDRIRQRMERQARGEEEAEPTAEPAPPPATEETPGPEPVPQPTSVSEDGTRATFSAAADPNAEQNALRYAESVAEEVGEGSVEVRPLRRGTGFEVRVTEGLDEAKRAVEGFQDLSPTQRRKTVKEARQLGFDVSQKTMTPEAMLAVMKQRQGVEAEPEPVGQPEPPAEAAPDPVQTPAEQKLEQEDDNIGGLPLEKQVQKLKRLLNAERSKARTEPLTGLGNKLEYTETLSKFKQQTDETGRPFSVLLFDAANLKAANDVYGHEGADIFLKEIAKSLRSESETRDKDVVVTRQGGDEFAVILPNMTRKNANKVLERVEAAVGQQEIIPGLSMFLAGDVATYAKGGDLDAALQRADSGVEARKALRKKRLGEVTTRSEAEAAIAEWKKQQKTRTADELTDAVRNQGMPRDEAAQRMVDPEAVENQVERGTEGAFDPSNSDALLDAAVPQIERVEDESKVRQAVSKNVTPVGTVIRRWAPRLYGRIKQMQSRYRRDRHDADVQAHKLDTMLKKALSDEQRQRVLYNWQTGNFEEARQIIDANAASTAAEINGQLNDVLRIKDRARTEGVKAGLKIGMVENHFPRQVKPDKYRAWAARLQGEERSELDLMLAEAARKTGRALTEAEEAEIANRWLAGYRHTKPGETSPRVLSRRSVEDLTFEDWQEFYQTDLSPLYTYFDRLIYYTHKARLFGKVSPEETMEETLGRMMVEGKYGINKLSPYQKERLRSAIGSIFTGGEQSPAAFFRWARDLGYMGTLLDPSSAAIQFGDLALIAARDGTLPMLDALPQAMREKVLTAKNLGMEHLSEEYGTHGQMATSLRRGFKSVGFHEIDIRALTANMVSAVRQARRLASAPETSRRFKNWTAEWGPVFGEEFPALVRDLRNGVNSDLVQDYAYMQASETRPNDIMDMPENYARHRNARILWQLKGFALKQFDFIRKRGYRNIARGVRNNDAKLAFQGVGELTRVMMILSVAGATFDWIRDWLLGRNPDFSESLVNGLLYTHLGSIYLLSVAGREGPGSAIVDFVEPPAPGMVDQMWRDVNNGTYTSLKYVPFGKTIYSFTPEHEAKMSKYARQDALKAAALAYKDGDEAAAKTYVNAFNDEMKKKGIEKRLTMSSVRRSAAQRD